jgi:hypothetical protein
MSTTFLTVVERHVEQIKAAIESVKHEDDLVTIQTTLLDPLNQLVLNRYKKLFAFRQEQLAQLELDFAKHFHIWRMDSFLYTCTTNALYLALTFGSKLVDDVGLHMQYKLDFQTNYGYFMFQYNSEIIMYKSGTLAEVNAFAFAPKLVHPDDIEHDFVQPGIIFNKEYCVKTMSDMFQHVWEKKELYNTFF